MKNFAAIGVAGYVAPRHLKAINDTGNRLVAAVDINDSVGILDRYTQDVRFFTEITRFVRHLEKLRRRGEEDRVHYMSIMSPNYLHDAHCRLALRLNANVICEKPLVINPWNLDQLALIESENEGKINADMPKYVVQKVQDTLNEHAKPLKGSKVLVLGAAYKPDIDDVRESPAIDVMGLLLAKGSKVSYHDPYIPKVKHDSWRLESVPDLQASIEDTDCVVVIANHSSYDYTAILESAPLIVDSRNAFGVNPRRW